MLEFATLTALSLLALVLWSLIDIDLLSAANLAGVAAVSLVLVAGTGALEGAASERGEASGELGNLCRFFSMAALLVALPAMLVQLVRLDTAPAAGFAPSACPIGDVPETTFDDVRGHAHEKSVSCAVWWKLASGADHERFAPDAPVTLRQMNTLLSRVAAQVDQSAEIRSGDLPGGATVSRAQLAAALSNLFERLSGEPLPLVLDAFRDDEGHALEEEVNRAAAAGLVEGSGDREFDPHREVTRAQAVTGTLRLVDRLVDEGKLARPD